MKRPPQKSDETIAKESQQKADEKIAESQQILMAAVQIAEIVPKLLPSVREWVIKYRRYGIRGAKTEWKQILKNKFVLLTLFGPSRQQRKHWRSDLEKSADQTIAEMCPDWKFDIRDRDTYDKIQKEKLRKKSPRQDWLKEKAYSWLKVLKPEPHMLTWYPHHAIQVAHQIFLSRGGKLQSFVNYLKHDARSMQPQIRVMMNAYESSSTGLLQR